MRHIRAVAVVCAALFAAGSVSGCKGSPSRSAQSSSAQPATAAPAASSGQGQSAAGKNDDTAMTTKIQAKFYSTPALKDSDIGVLSDNGVVTLAGTVPSDEVKQQAVSTAQQVSGVRRVDDRLSVAQPGQASAGQGQQGEASPGVAAQPPAGAQSQAGSNQAAATDAKAGVADQLRDGLITVKVQSAYFADPDVKGRHIDVDAANGVVTLSGKVDSTQARDRAVQLARGTEGVKRVDDRLQVVSPNGAAATSGRSDELPKPAATTPAGMPDDDITTRIQSKFFSDDTLRPSRIDVTTKDGVVTLGGTAATQGQREQAVALASSTNGVQRVDDEIRVEAPPRSVGTVGQLPAGQAATRQVPDDQLKARVQSKYFLSDTLKKNDITVSVQSGVVTLNGSVDSQDAKREAEDLAQNTVGVSRVVDNLAVKKTDGGGQ